MEFEGLRRSSHSPSLTPLIDIVFLLLVFFMLTAHFVEDEAITIALPEAQSSTELKQDEVVQVLVDAQGRAYINGEEIAITELEMRLRIELQDRDNKWVTLRGDQGADLAKAVAVLDAARRAGADAVDIVTNRP